MKTKKPISTVSFNTSSFLRAKLDQLVQDGIFSWYCFICHKPEKDETKEHYHVYAEPSNQVQTDDIRKLFEEFDPDMPDKPRGTLLWVSSKFDDWYDYALHDPAYLASKGLFKKFSYSKSDMITADEDELINRVNDKPKTPQQRMMDAIQNGMTFETYVAYGCVPVRYINNYRMMYQELWNFCKHNQEAEEQEKRIKDNLLRLDGFVPVPDDEPVFGDI